MKKNDDLPQNDVKEEKKEQNSMLYVDNTFGGKQIQMKQWYMYSILLFGLNPI